MSMKGILKGFPEEGKKAVLDYLRAGSLTSPGLAIAEASSPAAKASGFSYRIDGQIHAKAAQDTIVLTALTVPSDTAGAAFLFIDASGTVAVEAVAANDGGDIFVPEPDDGYCLFGAVKVAASNASFTGGTTALDATGITATFANLSGAVPGDVL